MIYVFVPSSKINFRVGLHNLNRFFVCMNTIYSVFSSNNDDDDLIIIYRPK
jgi:hypothetical protein